MRRAYFIIVMWFIVFPQDLKGQSLKIPVESTHIGVFPDEKIFVHYNSSLLFSGEYLYYKIYTFNTDTGLFSNFSRISYIELVGEDGSAVIKQKVLLDKGIGEGDLFIPTSVPSGKYKLIAYTQWMANKADTGFFRGDLVLLNPYQGDQSGLGSSNNYKIQDGSEGLQLEIIPQPVLDKNIILSLQEKVIGTRERVGVKIRNAGKSSLKGNFSISVRKTDNNIDFSRPTALEISKDLRDTEKNNLSRKAYLPELRGDLITGRLNGREENTAVSGKIVAAYIPGEDPVFKTALTNEDGTFFINLNREYSGEKILMQVVGEPGRYDIAILQDPDIKHSSLNFPVFTLTPEMKNSILERSIHNQIENAYYVVKPDTIKEPARSTQFYGEEATVYNLDEFTRFPTIRETFVEIVTFARIANNRNGNPELRLRLPEGTPDSGLQPLLVVDGMLVQDHNLIIEYPAHKVKSIRIIREKYYNGPLVFQGVIAIETREGNFYEERPSPYIKEFDLEKPQPLKKYFRQTYDQTSKNSRIPDFRYQLAWIPGIEIKGSETELEFYTSDVPGSYEINMEGFLEDGTPVTIREYFKVE